MIRDTSSKRELKKNKLETKRIETAPIMNKEPG